MPWLCGMRIPTYVGVHVACSMRVDECQQRKFRSLPSADWSDFMLTQVSHVLRVQHLRPAPLPRCFRTPGVLRLGLHCLGAWVSLPTSSDLSRVLFQLPYLVCAFNSYRASVICLGRGGTSTVFRCFFFGENVGCDAMFLVWARLTYIRH